MRESIARRWVRCGSAACMCVVGRTACAGRGVAAWCAQGPAVRAARVLYCHMCVCVCGCCAGRLDRAFLFAARTHALRCWLFSRARRVCCRFSAVACCVFSCDVLVSVLRRWWCACGFALGRCRVGDVGSADRDGECVSGPARLDRRAAYSSECCLFTRDETVHNIDRCSLRSCSPLHTHRSSVRANVCVRSCVRACVRACVTRVRLCA